MPFVFLEREGEPVALEVGTRITITRRGDLEIKVPDVRVAGATYLSCQIVGLRSRPIDALEGVPSEDSVTES